MPLDVGTIRGLKTRLHLYTVPGQVFYDASRRLILKGADGVVFVADSQAERMESNLDSFENMEENLRDHGFDLLKLPVVMQWNKRDLPSAVPVEELEQELNPRKAPSFPAVATHGQGVFETLKAISKLVLEELKQKR